MGKHSRHRQPPIAQQRLPFDDEQRAQRHRIIREQLDRMINPRDPQEYADAIQLLLGLAASNMANRGSSLATWEPQGEKVTHTFPRHALPMVWDFAEINPFAEFERRVEAIALVLERLPIRVKDAHGRIWFLEERDAYLDEIVAQIDVVVRSNQDELLQWRRAYDAWAARRGTEQAS